MAQVKNFGLKGVASDVQFGKAGGRLVFNPTGGVGGSSVFSVVDAEGTNVSLQGRAGAADNEFVTLAQLNSVSAGIEVKGSCRLSTQLDIVAAPGSTAIFNAGGGTGGTGQFTGAPTEVDGVTIENGDRILVRLEGVVVNPDGTLGAIDEVAAQRNGIYVVMDAALGTWERAQDHDENEEVTYGNYTFITEGADSEGRAYVLTNVLNKPIVANGPTLNAEPITFAVFSSAPTYEAAENGGLEAVNGDEFRLDIDNLTSTTSTLNSTVAIGNGLAGGPDSKTTLSNIFNTHNVVYGLPNHTGNAGFVIRTAEDTYKMASLQASTTPALLGINLAEDLAGAGTVEVGLDINGLTSTEVNELDTVAFYDASGTSNNKRTWQALAQDLDIARTNTFATGLVTKIGDDVYAGREISSAGGANGGIAITNGDFISGNAVIGLDMLALGTKGNPELADKFIINDNADGANKQTTIQGLIDIIAENVDDNEISEDDSRVAVIDDGIGNGTVVIDVDAANVATFTNTKATFSAVEVADIGDTQIVVGGPLGRLSSSAGFTYNGLALDVTGNIVATGDVEGFNASFTGNIGAVDGNFSGNINAEAGMFNGNVSGAEGNFSGAITGASLNTGTGSIIGGDTTVADLSASAITADSGTFTGNVSALDGDFDGHVTVGEGLSVTGGGAFGAGVTAPEFLGGTFSGTTVTSSTLTDGRVTFAGAGGQLIDSANLTFDGSVLTVTGTIETTGGITAPSIVVGDATVTTLTEGRVVLAGNGGALVDSIGLTFSEGNLTSATSVNSAAFVGGSFNGTTGTFSGAITGASIDVGTGNIKGGELTVLSANVSGDITGMGNVQVTGSVTGANASFGSGGITDASLSGNGAIVFSDVNQRLVDDGATFSYNAESDTLTVPNINVTGSFNLPVNDNEIAFGDPAKQGGVISSANFTVNDANATLSIGTLNVIGDTSQTVAGNVIDGDISIVPNGTGSVVIGSAGAGVIASDSGQSMTVAGSTSLYLDSGTGSTIIRDGGLNVAQFDAIAGADTHLTFQSDLESNGVKIGTSGNADIKFILSAGKLVKPNDADAYNAALATTADGVADAFVTKAFLESTVASASPVETYKSVVQLVDLSADGVVSINIANGTTLPQDAVVLRVKVEVRTADSTATLSIGSSVNTSRYMSTEENDPQETGIYVSELFDTDSSAIQLNAEVSGSSGDAGATALVSIEYRVPVTV